MAASSDLQALQLQNRNLQQKLDWKQLKINQRDKHIRDLRDATPARAADLERLERSLCRLSLQMEHMQLVIKKPEWSFHTFAMPEKTASSAHTIFVRPPSGNRLEVTIPPGKLPGDIFTVMLKDEDAYPPDWVWHAAPPAAPAHSAPPPWAEEQPAAQEGEDGEEGADEEEADEAALRNGSKPRQRPMSSGARSSGTPRPRRQAASPASVATQTGSRATRGWHGRTEDPPPPREEAESESRTCGREGRGRVYSRRESRERHASGLARAVYGLSSHKRVWVHKYIERTVRTPVAVRLSDSHT